MSYSIAKKGAIHLVGLKVSCPFEEFPIEIPKASLVLKSRVGEIKHVVQSDVQIGVHKEQPAPEEDAYFICYQVSAIADVPEGMIGITVPERAYAVAEYQGLPEGCHTTYARLDDWITEQGMHKEPAAWTLEKRTDLTGDTIEEVRAHFKMEIHMPLQ